MPLCVCHIITGLNTGGAETMLYKLLSRADRGQFAMTVISLTDAGTLGQRIQALGVGVRALGMRRGLPDPRAIVRLANWLREDKPDVVQTWMYHADLVGGLAAKLAGNIPVAWNIRHSNLDPSVNKRSTLWTVRACARLSRWVPSAILCNSHASLALHVGWGYMAHKMRVIPNGFDLEGFKPDPQARLSVRQELGIRADAPLVGLVARFDPLKDHRTFVRAAALAHASRPEAHYLLCGDDITWENGLLAGWIRQAGLEPCCHLLGRRADIPRINAAPDVATLSSCGESFPNVVGEAMACGVPCVVTDVGDAAAIVGETGIVVPPRDPQALAAGWLRLLEMGAEQRRALGQLARQRVAESFDLTQIVSAYERLYRDLARDAG